MGKIRINKIIIIAITSGLGNQLFQYSLYLYLKEKGQRCYAYPLYKYLGEHNGLELKRLFDDKIELKHQTYLLDKLFKYSYKIKPRLKKILELLKISYDKRILPFWPVRLVIFPEWNDYTFIKSISKNIQETFVFPNSKNPQNELILDEINGSESVSIHVRRGDFQKIPKWRCVLGDICNIEYYKAAIELIRQKKDNCKFFVFSDDINWVKENLELSNATYVDWNHGEESYMDLKLMSSCKHNILSNSTFSLWGAWLNNNPEKEVIAPLKWHNEHNDQTYKMYLDSKWNIIDNSRPNISIIISDKLFLSKRETNWLLKQRYNDFEIICHLEIAINDSRIVHQSKPTGNFHIYINTPEELKEYKDRNHLRNELIGIYEQQV